MTILRPYQLEAVDAIFREWQTVDATLLVAAVGSGKTQIFSEVLDRKLAAGGRGLVLAHRKELVEQARDRLLQFWPQWIGKVGVVMADLDQVGAQIVYATVQTLSSDARLARTVALGAFDIVVTDECFPAGTLVNGRPIETIAVGDTVTAWDEETYTFAPGKVTRTFKRPAPAMLVRVFTDFGELICTHTHPIFTDCGWKMAITLQPNDTLFFSGDDYGASEHPVCDVQEGVLPEYGSVVPLAKEGLVDMLSRMRPCSPLPVVIGNDGAHESARCQRAYAAQQSDVQTGDKGKDAGEAQGAGLGYGATRGQWRIDTAADSLGDGVELANRSGHFDGALPRSLGVSVQLQGGHRETRTEDCGGSGRKDAQAESAPAGGRQENRVAQYARVDHIEILELGRGQESSAVCPDGFVYNLEIERYHTYTANGLAVHNCHHSAADSYQTLYAKLREINPALKHLGVTATPLRADQVGIRSVYQSTAAKYDLRDMIRARYLVPPRWLAIQTSISLANVATRYDDGEKDYSANQLANVFETDNCYDLVVETHKQYADGRKCIAFTVTVDGAYKLAEKFNAAGIRSQAADGTTGKRERAQILADFRAGQTQVLCNVGLYTEGLDVPETSCIHQVRPTQSDGLYIQMIGRALRLFAGKSDALVLDYAPKEARQIVMLGDVLGAPVRKEALVSDTPERGEVLGGFTFDGEFAYLEGNPAEIISRQLDYLSLSPFVWNAPDHDGWMTLGLGKGGDERDRILAISPASELQTLYGLVKSKGEYSYRMHILASGDFETLQLRAEELAEKWGDATLAQKERGWRRQPVSDPQRSFLKRLGVRREVISRGEAAKVITHTLALQALHQNGVGLHA